MRQLLSRRALRPLAFAAMMAVGQGGPALGQERDPAPLPIKVVIVTMFELGEDQGDRPGEFQTWVERLPLPGEPAVPAGLSRPAHQPRQGRAGARDRHRHGTLGRLDHGAGHGSPLRPQPRLLAGGRVSRGPIPTTCRLARPPGPNGSSTAISRTRSTRARCRGTGPPATSRSAMPSPMRNRYPRMTRAWSTGSTPIWWTGRMS